MNQNRITVFFLFFFIPSLCFCQVSLDSLLNEIKYAKTSEQKFETNNKVALYYFSDLQDMRSAIPFFYKALKHSSGRELSTESADINNYLGICYETLGMHDSAIICFNNYLDFSLALNDDLGLSNAYKNLGLVYEFSGDYNNAIVNYVECSKIADKTNDTILLVDSYLNIGGVYRSLEQFDKSAEYFANALLLNDIIEDDMMYARIYNQLAILEKNRSNYEKAIEFYNLTLDYSTKIGWDTGLAAAYGNIGNVYICIEDYQKALDYHLKSLEIEEKLDHFYGIRISKNALSSIYIELGQFKLAEKYANQAYQMAKAENNYEGLSESIKYLFDISLRRGDTDGARDYFSDYVVCMDSIYSIESLEKIAEIETKYQIEKKELAIEFLSIQNQLEKDKNQKQKLFIIILATILAIALVLTVIIWKFYRQKHKAYLALVKMNVQAVKCEQNNDDEVIDKDHNHNIIDASTNELAVKIKSYIVKEKPYLQSDFSIDKLAKSLESNRQYISKTINDVFGKNFSTYINEFRVKEARKMLLNSEFDKFTMEAIAQKCGFSNRTSFIDAFKKYTGVTPSYFKINSNNIL